MTAAQKVYFVCAWIVAGLAVLATILLGVAYGGIWGFGVSLECIFLGITACVTLLYLSGFFTSQIGLFITGIGVACLALLSLILQIVDMVGSTFVAGWGWVGGASGTTIAGTVFLVLFLGLFSTILLFRLSGKFGD